MNFLEKLFTTSRTKQLLKQKQTTQNTLNRSLFSPYAAGLPFVMDNDKREFVQEGYERNSTVYSIINKITRSLAAIPWDVYVVKDSKAAYKYKNFGGQVRIDSPIKAQNMKNKGLELAEQSDLAGVIDRPNPHQGWSEFVENLQGFKEITGNTYVHGVEVDQAFGELWVMPAHLVEIVSSGNVESVIRGYRITEYVYDIELDAEEVMHMKYWNPDYSSVGSHLYGMSPIRAARDVVTQSNDTFTAQQRALQNMGAEGMLALDEDNVTDKQLSDFRKDLNRRGQGPDNYKKMLVSTAKWRWEHFGISPVDLNIIEAMRESKRELADIYGIDTTLLNDPENKIQANKSEARRELYYETILPKADNLRDELNRWLAADHSKHDGVEYFIDYDSSAIPALAKDIGKKVGWLQEAWPITPNEFRQSLNYDTIDEPSMDMPWAPIGRQPVGQEMDVSKEISRYSKANTNGTSKKDKV